MVGRRRMQVEPVVLAKEHAPGADPRRAGDRGGVMSIIEEESIRFVAGADITDDCRVESVQRRRRMFFTPSQAREHAHALLRYAEEADRAARELAPPTAPFAFDVAHISPDCSAGKCAACIGTAWDHDADEMTNCTHECHHPAKAVAA
jgi:hypothetical protein